jgi:hypothetical protein
VDLDREPEVVTAVAFRPRSAADFAVYAATLTFGPALWFWMVQRTGAREAWDEDLYWPVMLGASLVLGFLLGSSRLPYLESRVPLLGFLIAALLFLTHIPSVVITSDLEGVPLLPVTLGMFWPLFTAVGGTAATAGVLAHRALRSLLTHPF